MANFETSDGLTLYFSDTGQGVPVLCLSGLTRNSRDFSYIDGKLDGIRLIKMDYRGRGRSDWAKDPMSYSILRESQDALELLDHLDLAAAAILGSSRGGLCAMTIGAVAKDRLLGVAYNDIGPEIDPKGLEVINTYLGRSPTWNTLGEAAEKRAKAMTGFHDVPKARWREEVEKLYYQTPTGLGITYDPKLRDAVLTGQFQTMPDLWPFYTALNDLPIAVIRGEHSDILTAETFDKMATENPNAIMATIPDRGHIPFLDEPAAIDALRAWANALKAA